MKPNRNRWQNSPGNTEPYGSGRAHKRGHELYERGDNTATVTDDSGSHRGADKASGRGKPISTARERNH